MASNGPIARLSATPWKARLALLAVVLTGGLIRLHHSGDLSLWLDEGLNVYFSRLPWDRVLGLLGSYDAHPPLYYAIVKAAGLLVPEVYAGRLLSVIAGTAVIPVVYLLGRRLLGSRAAIFWAGCAALSPLLVWYSQEGRMYSPTILPTLIAYLALVAIVQTGAVRWAVVYAVSLWLAMSLDYSAAFAIAPHVVLILLVLVRNRRRGMMAGVAAVAAATAYLPWALEAAAALGGLPEARAGYLGLSGGKFLHSVLAVVGISSGDFYFAQQGAPLVWDGLPFPLKALVVCVAAVALGGGLLIILRRSWVATGVALSLFAGTLLVTASVTLFLSPGWADRTVQVAAFGSTFLLGTGAAWSVSHLREIRRGRWRPAFFAACTALTFAASSYFLVATQVSGDKMHWRDMAEDAGRVAALGYPVVTYPGSASETFLDLYAPGAVVGKAIHLDGSSPITAAALARAGAPGAVWYAYFPFSGFEARFDDLKRLGYQNVMQRYYWNPLWLALFAQPGVVLGHSVDVNGGFGGDVDAAGWTATGAGVSFTADADARDARLVAASGQPARLVRSVPATSDLYSLTFDVVFDGTDTAAHALLTCVRADGSVATSYPDPAGTISVAGDGHWHAASITALCDVGTTELLLDFRSAATGVAQFRHVQLLDLPVPATAGSRPEVAQGR